VAVAPGERTRELLRHLASRPGHDEVKADFRDLLVAAFGVALDELEFERRVPEVKGRLDALIGRTVFEAKSNLDREWGDVLRRMPDYLADREREEGEQFIGIASDGRKWVAFERAGGGIVEIKNILLDPEQPDVFLAWLDGAVALGSELPPEPLTIRIELGQDSVAFRRARAKLEELWARLKHDPAVTLKRQLWAQLLKLVYGREVESDALFFQHTFLVVVAKAIALAVLDMREDDPARILSGQRFADAGIAGAVESDFFDWIVADAEGKDLVRRIVAHVRRFRLREVESDILKVLYESLIDRDERHGLGEYYTPDWLAAKVVRRAVERPDEQKVLDPACGSGTFLFHAVRNCLAEAEENGVPDEIRAAEAAALVAGLDIHPVAVIIARVTYLLALAPALSARKGRVAIPVYLGDAMQLSVTQFWTERELGIDVPADPDGKGATRLVFPELFCRDAELFDTLIEAMRADAEAGVSREDFEAHVLLDTQRHYRELAVRNRQKAVPIGPAEENAAARLGETYLAYDALRRAGRDSIWTYVARNLSRPLSLSVGIGWANVVVGNPPWVAFRHMNAELQQRFRELAKGAKVYVGGKFATQNDFAALFTVRAASLYLRNGGRLAFVLPLAALTRGQFERLRTGSFTDARIAWDEVWTMDDRVQPLFPVPACVVFGRRRATARPMPDNVRAYSGDLPFRDAPEAIADAKLAVVEGAPRPAAGVFEGGSPYRAAFRDGATLYPRMLCLVERPPAGRLGSDVTTPFVVSRQTSQDKRRGPCCPRSSIGSKPSFSGRCCLAKASCHIACFVRSRALSR
jgi:hypothetical protein